MCVGRERAVIHYDYQDMPDEWIVWVDSDWAGCRVTRKSTSGGLAVLGSHVIRTWSTTQSVIAMSSGEAEYYSIVKVSSMGMGIKAVAMDMGVFVRSINVNTDASAANGIASRRGLGKIRHIEVSQVWLQDRVSSGEIIVAKVRTNDNLADALTKYVESSILELHMRCSGLVITKGRHELAE